MSLVFRALSLSLLSFGVILDSLTCHAQQAGHYIGGFTGLESGSTPPPGLFIANFGMIEPIDTIKGPDGNTVLRPKIDVAGGIAVYQVVFPQKILGGNYTLAFMVRVLSNRFNSNLFNVPAETAGLSDVLFEPIGLGWTKGRVDYSANSASTRQPESSTPTSRLIPALAIGSNRYKQVSPGTSTRRSYGT